MIKSKQAIPFGLVTILLVAVTWAYSWFNQNDCVVLEKQMTQGYFLRWMPPQLLLVTANKQTLIVESDSKSHACTLMLAELAADK